MADLTWLRVGGPADWLFQPADEADLADFLRALPPEIPVFPMGVGSNLIVRDGGVAGVVVRLGRGFNAIRVEDGRVIAGAAALDAHVARRAAAAGVDLTFLRTIPGTIGGGVRMNAGCYGTYVADVFVERARRHARRTDGDARRPPTWASPIARRALPPELVLTEATLVGPPGEPAALEAQDGGADRPARREPADEGPLGGLDLPQPGRLSPPPAAPTTRTR